MVFIKNTSAEYILREIVVSLISKLKNIDPKSIDAAFASWIYPRGRLEIKAEQPTDFVMSNYTHVAQLGYLIDIYPDQYESQMDDLIDGLSRTSLRPSIVMGSPAAFCNDAIALFGIALGAKRIGGETMSTVTSWMQTFPNLENTNLPNWKKTLIEATYGLLDNFDKLTGIAIKNESSDMQLALISRGIDCLPEVNFDQAYHTVCDRVIHNEDDYSVIGARLNQLSTLQTICPRFPLATQTLISLPTSLETSLMPSDAGHGKTRQRPQLEHLNAGTYKMNIMCRICYIFY